MIENAVKVKIVKNKPHTPFLAHGQYVRSKGAKLFGIVINHSTLSSAFVNTTGYGNKSKSNKLLVWCPSYDVVYRYGSPNTLWKVWEPINKFHVNKAISSIQTEEEKKNA